jgi:hypothetical protein
MNNSAVEFLSVAKSTLKERGKIYDKSTEDTEERSMASTVQAFNAITGLSLSESDGWLFMLTLKQVRQQNSSTFHYDSAMDGVAYSALLAECQANAM